MNQHSLNAAAGAKVKRPRKRNLLLFGDFKYFLLFKNRKTEFVVKLDNIGLLTPRSLPIEQETDQSPFNSFAIAIHWENDFFAIMILILT